MRTPAAVRRAEPAPWLRLLSFAVGPVLGAVAPLIVLPAITSQLGATGWAAIAIGQGLGVFAMTLTASGWGTIGPPLLARTEEAHQPRLYRTSLTSRLMMAAPVWPVTTSIAYVLAPSPFKGSAALMVAAMAVWGLTPDWILIGRGQAFALLAFTTLPRLLASALSAGMLSFAPYGWVFPSMQLAFGAGAVLWALRLFGGGDHGWHLRDAARHLRVYASLNVSRFASTVFTSLAVPVVALVSPSSVATYAAVDRLRSLGSSGISPVTNAFQGWIYVDGQPDARRQRTAALVVIATGAAGALCMVAAAPLISRYIFSNVVHPSLLAFALQGVALVAIATGSTMAYHYAAPLDRFGWIAESAWVGCAVGTVGLLIGGRFLGTVGASLGIVLAEVFVAATLVRRLRSNWSTDV